MEKSTSGDGVQSSLASISLTIQSPVRSGMPGGSVDVVVVAGHWLAGRHRTATRPLENRTRCVLSCFVSGMRKFAGQFTGYGTELASGSIPCAEQLGPPILRKHRTWCGVGAYPIHLLSQVPSKSHQSTFTRCPKA